MSSITVGINLLWLVPGQVGGSEESTLASVRALAALSPPDLDLRLFVLDPLLEAHPDLPDLLPVEVLPRSGRSRAARIAAESTWLSTRTRGVDLVHHAGGTAPPRRAAPYVLTLHDLQPLERDATHGRLKRAYLGVAAPRSVHSAATTVVPSEFVRTTVLEHMRVTPDKVVVVPHGVDRHPHPTPREDLVARYGLEGPVVLYPAISYPHKNHAVLVDAFARIAATHPESVLVLPGGPGACEPALRAQIHALGLSARVLRPGRIPAADVAGLYELATVVAVPSRDEGFGLPAAEAMAYGAPLVVADATALPEVVGDAGLRVAPDDEAGWAGALDRILGDAALRARLGAAGAARAASFTWPANAAALADVYRHALP